VGRLGTDWTKKSRLLEINEDDPQAHLVFRAEEAFAGFVIGCHTDHDLLRKLTDHICKRWKVDIPEITFIKNRSRIYGWCDPDDGLELNVTHNGDTSFTLMHEMAHWIVMKKGYKVQDHGPEWANIYMELLDQYHFVPRSVMSKLFDEYGVIY
jgi:hypothetical protein